MSRQLTRPDELEVLASTMLGPDSGLEPLPAPRDGGVRAALEHVLLEALSSDPCVVSFSGGRDSSAILALATDVARRHGLPLPLPVIMRFPGAPDTDETAWQKIVLEHLGLPEAEVLELREELDLLGPAAIEILLKHGLLWPANAYMHRPIFDAARGGTVLTGAGGDELFGTRAPRRRPRQLVVAALPSFAREAIWLRRHDKSDYRWLTDAGRERVHHGLAREETRCPYRWDGALRSWYSSRAFGAGAGSLALIGTDYGVEVVNPLMAPQVLAELSLAGGRRGFPSRTAAMRWLCGDLLTEHTIARPTKASFGGAVWGPATKAFAAAWDGHGVDRRFVDVELLKREVQLDVPDFRAALLLQQAWLRSASEDRRATERRPGSRSPGCSSPG